MSKSFPVMTLALTLASVLCAPNGAARADDDAPPPAGVARTSWFPLEAGNEWILREPITGEVRVVQCDAVDDQGCQHVVGLLDTDLWLYYHPEAPYGNEAYVWNADAGAWYELFDFDAPPLEAYPAATSNATAAVRAERHDQAEDRILTAVGAFRGCEMFDLSRADGRFELTSSDPTTLRRALFAPGVGPIELGFPRSRLLLVSASVGGAQIPDVAPAWRTCLPRGSVDVRATAGLAFDPPAPARLHVAGANPGALTIDAVADWHDYVFAPAAIADDGTFKLASHGWDGGIYDATLEGAIDEAGYIVVTSFSFAVTSPTSGEVEKQHVGRSAWVALR